MKKHTCYLTLLLCLILLFSACGNVPAETTVPTTDPVSTTAPTESGPTPQQIYQAAAQTQRADLKLTVSQLTERTIQGQTYTAQRKGTVTYTAYGTEKMTAISQQKVTYGTYETDVIEQYINGIAYLQLATNPTSFGMAMTPKEYAARELPAALLEVGNYASVAVSERDDLFVLTFSDASVLEAWVTDDPDAVLISAGGTAELNADGIITRTDYTADYRIGDIVYHTEASVIPEDPQSGELTPSAPGPYSTVKDLDAPLLILQAVGDLFTAESISATAQELLIANAAALVRNSQTQINLHGTDSDFMAKVDVSVSQTNYTGQTYSTKQTELFRDGSYSFSIDGSNPSTDTTITAATMRGGCEDLLLYYMMDIASVSVIDITDTGDFYLLSIYGDEAFYAGMEAWIDTLVGVKLKDFATSTWTTENTSYLAINKLTGLPVSMGIRLGYAHTIEGVTYDLTYDCAQSITLSSNTSYKAITGAFAPETKPQNTATPLFYKVTGKDGQTLWLLGTIHVGDERTAFLPQKIYDALDASDALAVEMDVNAFEKQLETDPVLQQQVAAGYYFSDSTTISSLLDPAQYQAAKNMLIVSGNYLATVDRMKPALWENTISNFLLRQSCGLISDKGVDQRLMALAQNESKPIWNIEDPVSHMLLTTNYSIALQNYLLKGTVETTLKDYRHDITELYDLWCKGDEKALTEAITAESAEFTQQEADLYAEYYKTMTTDRNQIMLQRAQEYLESGDTVFFAVGLAHVVGEDGIVALLRQAGYTVEPVSYH